MKRLLSLGFVLLLVPQVYAGTYSWVDGSGTYNYTEDYSSVPVKYRKKVEWREDVPRDAAPSASPDPGSESPGHAGRMKENSAAAPDSELYGGKTFAAWGAEKDALEAELNGIEQRLEQLRSTIHDSGGLGKAQFEVLKHDYDDNRATYDRKYKQYSELIEKIRNAGIEVKIKK